MEQADLAQPTEQPLQLALRHAPIGMALVAPNGQWLMVNPALTRMLGYSEEELLATDFQKLTHPDDLDIDVEFVRQMLAGEIETYQMEKRYVTKAGDVLWALLSVSLVRGSDSAPLFFISQIMDLSERKRLEQEQAESAALWRAMFESKGALRGVVTLESGDIRHLIDNGQTAKFLGVEPEDTQGRLASELGIPQSIIALWARHYEQSRQTGAEVTFEYAHDTGGEKRYLQALVTYIGDDTYGRDTYTYAVHDITELRNSQDAKLNAIRDLRASLEATVEAIAATIEARDSYTAGHQKRVAMLAKAIAREMGLASEVVEGIHFGGLIHDLGKIQIPAEILAKPTRLTKLEFSLIQTHARAGYDIIRGIQFPWPVAEMVLQHHERLDGSGYPQGLKGDAILPESRILAVADIVEAMASHRPYRPGHGIQTALAEIRRQRGTQLEASAVDACCRLFSEARFSFT